MPHLSPMNWLLMMITSFLFIMFMKSTNWWSKPQIMPYSSLTLNITNKFKKWMW